MTIEKTHLLKLLTLLFFNGTFAVCYAGILIRETSVRCYASELAYLIPTLFLLFFAAVAFPFASRAASTGNRSSGFPAVPCFLASAALALIFLLPMLSMTRKGIMDAAWILPLMALPFFFFGVLLQNTLMQLAGNQSHSLFAALFTGGALAGILFSLLAHTLSDMLAMLLTSGFFFLISSLVFFLPNQNRKTLQLLHLLTAFTALLLLVDTTWGGRLEQNLAKSNPLRQGKDSLQADTAIGRTELFTLPDNRYLITTNGQGIVTLPANLETDRLTALTVGIQPDKKKIRVLLICNEFSGLPAAFAAMPLTSDMDVVFRSPELMKLSGDLGLLPPQSLHLRLTAEDPETFLRVSPGAYDVIFVEPPLPQNLDAARYYSVEFYQFAEKLLNEGGIFATYLPAPYGYTRGSIAELHGIIAATMRRVFPKVIFAPGTTQIAIGGAKNLTGDLDTLDARAGALISDQGAFPEGLLVILHSQAEQQEESRRIIGTSIISQTNRLYSAPLLLNYWRRHPVFSQVKPAEWILNMLDFSIFHWHWMVAILLASYLTLRYFLTDTIQKKAIFRSLEHGFFAAGTTLLFLFVFQMGCGTLYRMGGLFLGILFAGAAVGVSWNRIPERWRILAGWFSLFLPFAAYGIMLPGVFLLPGLTGILIGLVGLTTGISLRDRLRPTEVPECVSAPGQLLCSLLTGSMIGILLISFFMFPGHGFLFSTALLAFSRLNAVRTRA